LTVDFTAPFDAQNAKLDIKVQIGPIVTPWPDQPTNICNNFVPCPMEAAQNYTFLDVIAVLYTFPAIEGRVITQLNDGNGNDLFCFKLDVKLV